MQSAESRLGMDSATVHSLCPSYHSAIHILHSAIPKGWLRGLEPPTSGATVRRSNLLSYSHHGATDERGKRRIDADITSIRTYWPPIAGSTVQIVSESACSAAVQRPKSGWSWDICPAVRWCSISCLTADSEVV